MGGSSNRNASTRTAEPWSEQIPYLREVFSQAQQLYHQPGPSYFPGATVAPFAPETELALNAQAARATAGSPLAQSAAAHLQNTVAGNYLNANPYLQSAIDAASQGTVRNYRDAVAPGIDSSFSLAGRYGSGAHQQAHGLAQQNLADQLGDISSNLLYRNYGDERANQMQAAALAPQLAQLDYYDIGQLGAVGQARQAHAQDLINDQVARYNFEQQLPWNKLSQYLGLIQGSYGGTTTETQPYHPGANFLSGAATGANIADTLGAGSGWGGALAGFGGLLNF